MANADGVQLVECCLQTGVLHDTSQLASWRIAAPFGLATV